MATDKLTGSAHGYQTPLSDKGSSKRKPMLRAAMLLAAAITLLTSGACAMTPEKKMMQHDKRLTQSYAWYDDGQRHTAWLDPELLVEFEPLRDSKGSDVRSLYARAQEIPSRQSGIRLWRLAEVTSTRASSDLTEALPGRRFSPVLRDQPHQKGSMRALPGGVIVTLDATWSEDRARRWLERNSLQVLETLEFRANTYLVDAKPGLASLKLANRLHEFSETVTATPNWWLERHTR